MRHLPATMGMLVPLILAPIADVCAQCADPPIMHWVGTNTGPDSNIGHVGRHQIHVDTEGAAYMAGGYADKNQQPVDLDPTDGYDPHFDRGNNPQPTDIYATKVHPDGYVLWTETAGDEYLEGATSAAIDSKGRYVYAGVFLTRGEPPYRVDFDPTNGRDFHTLNGVSTDTFVTKLYANGSYAWTRTFGTSADAGTRGGVLAVTPLDEVVLTGAFEDRVDFDPGPGEDFHDVIGQVDAFVLKLNSKGKHVWARTFGGPGAGVGGSHLRVNERGDILVLGSFSKSVDFNPGKGEDWRTAVGDWNVFVTLLRADGAYGWTRILPQLYATRTELDANGRILISGMFEGTIDFDPTNGIDRRTSNGDRDSFVSLWTPDGDYLWTRTFGGRGSDGGDAFFSSDGTILASGAFQKRVDFDPGEGVDQRRARGEWDAYLCRWSADGEYEWTISFGGEGYATAGVHYTAEHQGREIWLTGTFTETVDFDPGEGIEERTALGDRDNFLLKLTCDDPAKCDALLSHKAKGKKGKVRSKLRTTLSGGKATVACTGDPGRGEAKGKIKSNGKARVAVKNLSQGDYTCAVTHLKDSQGNTVCKGEFLPKEVTVR